MCKEKDLDVIELDEQELFTVLYCKECDLHYDGFGTVLELEETMEVSI